MDNIDLDRIFFCEQVIVDLHAGFDCEVEDSRAVVGVSHGEKAGVMMFGWDGARGWKF
jgi:hypothetical protein